MLRPSRSLAFCALSTSCAALLAAGGCDDDGGGTPAGTGGAAGSSTNPAGSSGASGTAGTAGSSGEAGSGGGQTGNAGTGGGGFVPDELKNCEAPASPSVPPLQFTGIAGGLESPVYLTQPRGDQERLFVVEKPGVITILRDGEAVEPPFLDINDLVSERFDEMGLLGLAFHPDYAENGRFFIYYSTVTNGPHESRVVEYRVSESDPDQADPSSARILMEIAQPQDNHNGGDLEFGPDGFLYIGTGDGGGANDDHGATGNGQSLNTLLGKLLRIDVDGTGAGEDGLYGIPEGNLSGGLPELFSYGLRNPWRFSFDACTGDLYIADVGQDTLEEVNFAEREGTRGLNYGWRLMEAEDCFNPGNGCDAENQGLVLPVASYGRDIGQSITGGYVYRGSAIPELRGAYLYADYVSGEIFALRMNGGSVAQPQQLISSNIDPEGDVINISSFGQDNAGELYVTSTTGSVFRIDAR